MPHSLTLQTSEEGYEYIPDIKISLDISPGSRVKSIRNLSTWPTEMLDVTANHGTSTGTVHLVTPLSNSDEGTGRGTFPHMKLQLVTANGKIVDPSQLQQLRLDFEVQVRLGWRDPGWYCQCSIGNMCAASKCRLGSQDVGRIQGLVGGAPLHELDHAAVCDTRHALRSTHVIHHCTVLVSTTPSKTRKVFLAWLAGLYRCAGHGVVASIIDIKHVHDWVLLSSTCVHVCHYNFNRVLEWLIRRQERILNLSLRLVSPPW